MMRVVVVAWGILFSCISGCTILNGDITFFSVKGTSLVGPRQWAQEDKSDFIQPGEVFSIVFENAFFRYLPDPGEANEVIVVFTIEEGSNSSEEDRIVKILGPINRIADRSYSSRISFRVYGPKPMDSDAVRIKVQIIEVDVEEGEQRGTFISFVADAAKTFSLDNPVTSGEIELAKQIALSLNNLDKNDEILEFNFGLFPAFNTAGKKDKNNNYPVIGGEIGVPLRAGHFGLIKRENTRIFDTYLHYVQNSAECSSPPLINCLSYPITFVVDIGLFPIVLLNRTFTDTPDEASIQEINLVSEDGTISDGKNKLSFNKQWASIVMEEDNLILTGSEKKDYKNKTWITFGIERGRDGSGWQARKQALKAERELHSLMRNPDATSEDSKERMIQAVLSVVKARQKAVEEREAGKESNSAKLNRLKNEAEQQRNDLKAVLELIE